MTTPSASDQSAFDAVGRVEQAGIDYIPTSERHSSPRNLFWVWIGAQMTFGNILIGWIPIAFGLGWWDAVTSITVGVFFGTIFFAYFSIIGPRTGTNSAVSSGAQFGVVGRMVGSIQALVIAIGYAAITIWVSGDILVSGLHALVHTSDGAPARALAYALISAAMIVLAVYGHANVVVIQKVAAPVVVVILLVGAALVLPHFDSSYSGSGQYLLGSYWPTWIFSAVIAAQLPISYTPFANDFARHVSLEKWSDGQILRGSGIGMFLGCEFVLVFGAFASTMFPSDTVQFGDGLVAISPTWFIAPLLVVAVLGSFAQGALALYGTGLDTSSIVPRLSRVQATLLISAVSLLFVYLGAFVWDALNAVSAFLLILLVLVVPWMVITLIGLAYSRGRYWPLDLQIFNIGGKGGAYWYTRGVNVRAAIAYVSGVIAGLLFVNTSIYAGPLSQSVGGVDVSTFTSGITAAVVYGLALWISPERNHPPAGTVSLASPVPVSVMGGPAAPIDITSPDSPWAHVSEAEHPHHTGLLQPDVLGPGAHAQIPEKHTAIVDD